MVKTHVGQKGEPVLKVDIGKWFSLQIDPDGATHTRLDLVGANDAGMLDQISVSGSAAKIVCGVIDVETLPESGNVW